MNKGAGTRLVAEPGRLLQSVVWLVNFMTNPLRSKGLQQTLKIRIFLQKSSAAGLKSSGKTF
jgi:hypothetical protein